MGAGNKSSYKHQKQYGEGEEYSEVVGPARGHGALCLRDARTRVRINPVNKIKGRLPKIRMPQVNPSLNFESTPPKQTVQAERSSGERINNNNEIKVGGFLII